MSKSAKLLDMARISDDFPILKQRPYGKRLAYLDNGASAQKPDFVIKSMTDMLHSQYANVHRGLHYLSNCATDLYEDARKTVQGFINASDDREIIFTKNATEAINIVAYGWAMTHLSEGDEIVLSIMEHHANIVPWHFLREKKGVKLTFIPVDDNGNLHIEAFEEALTAATKLVAITHMSNVLGTITPIKEIISRAHARNIPVLVDGSQAIVHQSVDVSELDCDWYAFTGHKLYGPTGIGVLYGKYNRLEEMAPFQGGGEMIEEVGVDYVRYNSPPHRFEAGTPPIVEAVGLASAIKYMQSIGLANIHAHEAYLLEYANARLSEIEGLRIFGQSPQKGGIISFEMAGIHPHDLAMYIDRQGVAVRAGTHCAQPLLARFGVAATCRASFALYNSPTDIDQLAESLVKARGFFHG